MNKEVNKLLRKIKQENKPISEEEAIKKLVNEIGFVPDKVIKKFLYELNRNSIIKYR